MPPRRHPLRRAIGLAPLGAKRRAQRSERDEVRTAVFDRDGWECRLATLDYGRCRGPLTPHHLRKASAGGAYSVANLVALCAHHNTFVEDFPDIGRRIRLVVREGDRDWDALGLRGAA